MRARSQVDRPIAVVNAVNTATPATWPARVGALNKIERVGALNKIERVGALNKIERVGALNKIGRVGAQETSVSVDHLNRPVCMTDAAKASVWDAVWQPWGGVHSVTGTASLDARLPGQWFQAETGLHYNWHRQYDPTVGRYTQPDPLGFVDGPSVYGYAGGLPQEHVDPEGQNMLKLALELCKLNPKCGAMVAGAVAAATAAVKKCKCKFEKHGRDHRFRDKNGKDMGFCEHYQVTCWVDGLPGSHVSYRWPLPGRCSKFKTSEPELPIPSTGGAP